MAGWEHEGILATPAGAPPKGAPDVAGGRGAFGDLIVNLFSCFLRP